MATPLSDTSSPSSTHTTSPTDTYPQQLRTASPDLNASPGLVSRSDNETKPARILQALHTETEEQVEIAGGKKSWALPSSMRYANNPHGTILTTIVERESNASLFEIQKRSQLPVRARVEQGLADAAALCEFESILNGTATPRSSSEEVNPSDRTNDLGSHVGFGKQPLQVFDSQNRNKELEDLGTCLSENRSSPSGTPKGPNPSRVALGQSSAKGRPECSSPKHIFHIFPDFIQLDSFSQNEDSYYVQSNSMNTSSNDSTITRYTPVGFIPPPPTHVSGRRVNRSSTSTQKSSGKPPPSSVTDNAESIRAAGSISPPWSNQDEENKTKSSRPLPLSFGSRNEVPTSSQQRAQQASRQTSCELPLNDNLEDSDVLVRANISWPTRDRSDASSPSQEQWPRISSAAVALTDTERSQLFWTQQSNSAPVNTIREISRYTTYPPSRAHSSHCQQSVSSSHDKPGTVQPGTPCTHTFRSAALESLLPIAAAEGIVIPYTLTPRRNTQVRTPSNPTTHFETSHSELSVLYHRGDICQHRAAAYAARGVELQDTLFQMLESVKVDGAVEIKEKKDWCWRCQVQKKWSSFSGVVMPKSCCFSGVDKADEFKSARLISL
jgi:hypothetical protein